jgi:hypothetical protein
LHERTRAEGRHPEEGDGRASNLTTGKRNGARAGMLPKSDNLTPGGVPVPFRPWRPTCPARPP